MEKPDVESVSGLSPAIAIEQRTTASHPRSTVGTVSEIYDHLRVLFAALGKPHCPRCGRAIARRAPNRWRTGSGAALPGRRYRCWPRSSGAAREPSRRSWRTWPPAATAASAWTAASSTWSRRPRSTPAAPTASRWSWTGWPCARAPRSGCANRWTRLSTSAETSSRSSSRAWASACTAGAWPAWSATSRCPSCPRARFRSTAPTARARRARASAGAGTWTRARSSPTRSGRCSRARCIRGSATGRAWPGRRSATWPAATGSPSMRPSACSRARPARR